MSNLIFSFCIPTYNSEKTIKYTLDSIMSQDFDKSKIEILIIDGGSSDNTLKIARKYPCVKILKNEKKLPEFAKLKAFNHARGKYLIMMDSDESFTHNFVLKERLMAFESYRKAVVLIADKLVPDKDFGVSNAYLNICGDPFSWFIYKNQHGILKTFKNNIQGKIKGDSNTVNLLNFENNKNIPIADSGTTTYNLEYIKKHYSNKLNDVTFIISVAETLVAKTKYCLCIENDNVLHKSKTDIISYLKKIKFRIINNIFTPVESGFSSRTVSKSYKKFVFPLYVFSFFLPLADSIILSVKYKTPSLLLHLFYSYYTAIMILLYFFFKIIGIKKTNREYV